MCDNIYLDISVKGNCTRRNRYLGPVRFISMHMLREVSSIKHCCHYSLINESS
jgi:hypothetical protein